MISTVKFAPHPLAKIFPAMAPEEKQSLVEDVRKNGLLEPITLFEDKVLDGVHRQQACVKAGVEPRYSDFSAVAGGLSPLDFVITRNLRRRHLTTSQRTVIAAELREQWLADAKNGAEEPGKTAVHKCTEPERTAEAAAKIMAVSPRNVMLAAKIVRNKPKMAAAIKAGKSTVGKASRDISKEQKAKAELAAAHERIEKICGAELAKAIKNKIRLKNPKDAVEFGKMDASEMKRLQGLIEDGWPLKKARLYKAKNLTLQHSIQDLVNRAISQRGSLSVDIERWKINVKRMK